MIQSANIEKSKNARITIIVADLDSSNSMQTEILHSQHVQEGDAKSTYTSLSTTENLTDKLTTTLHIAMDNVCLIKYNL
jgi:uncharacterized Zn finger protein